MSLTLIEGLREARSLPPFSGSTEYALTSYLRDVNTVLSLVGEEHKATIRSVLANRLQGKALKAIETLVVPTWEQIIAKLREEFGVRESFLGLRNQAMNVVALIVEELHHKLSEILNLMNTKYSLNPENNAMFSPDINQTLIFEIYLNSLSLNIKTLLIQNNIATISGAQSYLIENNLMKDVYLRKNSYTNNSREKNFDKGRKTGNYRQNNDDNRLYRPNPQNMAQHSGNNFERRGSVCNQIFYQRPPRWLM
ncbi:hypothetical protein FF38_00993 [Lucilia cuprina]|uniref:Uncharacterized protein n=1 Tax=Lucilia cuprina TaxID=7375 RepID=A0A0L0BXR2_LUCCU|nr:hypothetical protein FF38_00993 [Lucilia cuprina]